MNGAGSTGFEEIYATQPNPLVGMNTVGVETGFLDTATPGSVLFAFGGGRYCPRGDP